MNKECIVEVSATIKRVAILFSLGFEITDKKNIHETYYFSVITEILIHLNDLAQKLKKFDNGIYFTDDIPVTKDYKDIISLVGYFRNAACHNTSLNRRTLKGFLYANNVFAGDEYADDITIIMGDSKLFVNRHLVRLYKETLKKFIAYEELHSNANFKYAIDLAKCLNYID
jgi:hypothetical protein